MKQTIHIKRDKIKIFKNGIHLVYVRMDGMCLVFSTEKTYEVVYNRNMKVF